MSSIVSESVMQYMWNTEKNMLQALKKSSFVESGDTVTQMTRKTISDKVVKNGPMSIV